MVFLVLLLILTASAALLIGRYGIDARDLAAAVRAAFAGSPQESAALGIVVNLRLLRVIAAALIGAALSCAGILYQSLFSNPLASPDVLGVQAGSCVGAALAILCGLGGPLVIAASFLAGLIAVFLSMVISAAIREKSRTALVLAGVIVAGLARSVLGLVKFLADRDNALSEIVFWELASLAKVKYGELAFMAPGIIVCVALVLVFRRRLDYIALGDGDALGLGVNIRLEKPIVVMTATLLTASAVAVAGNVGWVGLIIPQMARIIAGQSYVKSAPAAVILGAIFLIAADTAARSICGSELPLSIITGIIGAPFLFAALIRGKGRMGIL